MTSAAVTAPQTLRRRRQRLYDELAWHRSLLPRAATMPLFKTASIFATLSLFFVGYFTLLEHPQFSVTLMPRTLPDDWIGFNPSSLTIYLTLWIYISLPPGLLDTYRDLLRYYAGISGLGLAGLVIFLLWPTASPRPEIDWTQYPLFGPLLAADHAGNAFPSLHCAFAVFTAIWFDRFLRHPGDLGVARSLNWLWCLGILYSTLATKQHVTVDLYGGSVLGVIAAVVHGRFLKRPAQYPAKTVR